MLLGGGVDGERAPKIIANTRAKMKDGHLNGSCTIRRVIKYISR